jgi:hypothetical protein
VFGKRIDSSPTWVTALFSMSAYMVFPYRAKLYLNGNSANAAKIKRLPFTFV